MHFHILHIEKEAEADPRDVDISLFCVPDIIVHVGTLSELGKVSTQGWN